MSALRSLFASPQFLSREEAERITQRVLRAVTADETRVVLSSGARANTRFAENQISTAGDNYDASAAVRSAFGRRVASASTNRLDDASLVEVVRRSEALARLAPEDPEYMGELGPQTYEPRPAPRQSGTPSPADRAAAVRAVTDPARAAGLVATGYMQSIVGAGALANSKGLFAYQRTSRTAMSTTVRTPDGTGSGWAGSTHDEWSQLNASQLGTIAIEKANLSRNPVALEPGRYTVILEPPAVANLVQLIFGGFGGAISEIASLLGLTFAGFGGAISARSADEGRSFFSKPGGGNKLGMKVVDERVTLISDPRAAEAYTGAYTGDGLPTRRVVWIENGIVRNLDYDRYWAQRQGVRPTADPNVVRMTGGTSTVAEMIRATDRGVLVTRLWYIRTVDPRTILHTGLTRDGTFLIENGRIARAVKNFRWNESPIFMLNNIEMLGQPVRVNASEGGEGEGRTYIVPPLKVRNFNFTSLSDAV